jgi:hypothetical protein
MKPPPISLVQVDALGPWLKDGESDRWVARLQIGSCILHLFVHPDYLPENRTSELDLTPDAPNPPGWFR